MDFVELSVDFMTGVLFLFLRASSWFSLDALERFDLSSSTWFPTVFAIWPVTVFAICAFVSGCVVVSGCNLRLDSRLIFSACAFLSRLAAFFLDLLLADFILGSLVVFVPLGLLLWLSFGLQLWFSFLSTCMRSGFCLQRNILGSDCFTRSDFK